MGIVADRWLKEYRANFESFELASAEVKAQLEGVFDGTALNVHLIEVRAKSPDSAAEKIERRGYGRPKAQLDDLLGARVIMLFDHSVKDAVKRIRARFDVDDRRSINKTAALGLRQVGYRSHHLVLKVSPTGVSPISDILRSTFVEVQIRSVISHAWAEAEHSLRYKIGSGVPEELSRRFDALAGTLELVDRELSSIEDATIRFVKQKSKRYCNGDDLEDELSTIQLLAVLLATRPDMKALGPEGLPLPIEDAFKLAKVLQRCDIRDVRTLLHRLESGPLSSVVRAYTRQLLNPVDPEEASGLVVVGAIAGLHDFQLLETVSAFNDPQLRQAIIDAGASTSG